MTTMNFKMLETNFQNKTCKNPKTDNINRIWYNLDKGGYKQTPCSQEGE
jgi:hypothetical protein